MRARLPSWRFPVFPHLGGDWGETLMERGTKVPEMFLKARIQIWLMPPALLMKTFLGLALFMRKKSKLPSSCRSGCFRQHAPTVCSYQQAPLSHLYLPHFLPPRGFGICCYLCLEACLLSPFPRKGFLTVQISAFHVSFPPASSTMSSLPFTGSHCHPFFVSLVAPYFLVRLHD